jgi:hypothetical protein
METLLWSASESQNYASEVQVTKISESAGGPRYARLADIREGIVQRFR